MLEQITLKGFQAVCLGWATYNQTHIYLRYVANTTAGKAIWAALNSRQTRETGVTNANIKGSYIRMDPVKYYTSKVYIKKVRQFDYFFLHPQATLRAEPGNFYLLHDGQSVPPAFFPMLNSRITTPFKQKWIEHIWQIGIDRQLIQPLTASGVAAYRVLAETVRQQSRWANIIQEGVQTNWEGTALWQG